jgi:predicted transcriptional regulator
MMSTTVTLTLDDETGAYLARMAADQGRTPSEVAAWIVTEDLRREQAIDADLLARLDDPVADDRDLPGGLQASPSQVAHRERTGA